MYDCGKEVGFEVWRGMLRIFGISEDPSEPVR